MSENPSAILPATDSRPTMCSGGWRRVLDDALHQALAARLGTHVAGRLNLTLPSGRIAAVGRDGDIDARLAVKSYSAIWRLLLRGHIGFAESYLDETVDSDDLEPVFAFFLANQACLTSALPGVLASARRDRRFHGRRANTRSGSRRNVAAHYDLGNPFYGQWLDASLTYSSGIYTGPDDTLEQAQAAKYMRILDALELRPGQQILEIGCGWGAMAEHLARAGTEVTGITISGQQHIAAKERIDAAGLADRAKVEFRDYRDTVGSFDRIVSVEMIEAVGEENWPTFFGVLADRLRPGGRAVVQAITIRDDIYDDYRRNPDFIQRFIFPGGMLPTRPMLRRHGEAAGLAFSEIERFGNSYARTLGDWQHRFRAAWPKIEALGFDVRFRRMWEYYLSYCKVGFERGTIDVGLYVFDKPHAVSSVSVRVA